MASIAAGGLGIILAGLGVLAVALKKGALAPATIPPPATCTFFPMVWPLLPPCPILRPGEPPPSAGGTPPPTPPQPAMASADWRIDQGYEYNSVGEVVITISKFYNADTAFVKAHSADGSGYLVSPDHWHDFGVIYQSDIDGGHNHVSVATGAYTSENVWISLELWKNGQFVGSGVPGELFSDTLRRIEFNSVRQNQGLADLGSAWGIY